jgi:hypothetical protein
LLCQPSFPQLKKKEWRNGQMSNRNTKTLTKTVLWRSIDRLNQEKKKKTLLFFTSPFFLVYDHKPYLAWSDLFLP